MYTRVICPPCERRAGNGRNTSVHCQINCTRFFRPGNICPVLSNVNALKRINSLPREKEKREIEISDSRSAPFRCQTEFHELVLRWCEQMRTFCAITSALPVSRPPGNRAARCCCCCCVSRDQRAVSLLSNRKRIPRERYNIIYLVADI